MNVTHPRPDGYFATNLKAVLDEQGRRQDWLAEQIGVSESFMSRVIRGHCVIMRDRAERAAVALGVPFFVLFELRDGSEIATNGKHNGLD